MTRTLLILALILPAACAPHAGLLLPETDTAETRDPRPAKPPRPVGPPAVLNPGLNTWTNPDGSFGAIWNDSDMFAGKEG